MSRYLFAHEEDDLQHPGLRRNPEPESDYNSFRAGMQGHYTRVHWPAAQERMQKGWRIHSPLYGMVMRWGTNEQKQLVKEYVQRQPGGLFGGREKLGGSETKTDEQLREVEAYRKNDSPKPAVVKSTIPASGLPISQPGDASEQHADAVADAVLNGGDAAELMQGVQTSTPASDAPSTTPAFDAKLQASKGSGQPLDENTRQEMEGKLGIDLSGVKIHTDAAAQEMADAVDAKAFTHGQDVYFGAGYSPADAGLLAHELGHVGLGNAIFRMPGDQWKTSREADFFQLINNTMVAVSKLSTATTAVELYYEYNDKTDSYYYVFIKISDQKTVTGFIRKDDLLLLETEPAFFDEAKDKVMREGVQIFYQLTKEQSEYFNWPAVIATFRALPAHKSVGQRYLEQWARKQLKSGWRLTDPVPDLTAYRAEFGEPKIYEITKEAVPTLYVYWYAENHAKIRHELLDKNKHNYKGFWVFVDSITGNESELQQNDSFAKFYQANPVSALEMTNLFLFIADRKIVVSHTQADIHHIGIDSEEFRIILENVQNVLYKGVWVSGYGMYTYQTRRDINKAVEQIKQKEQEDFQKEIAAYNQQSLTEISIEDQELVKSMSTSEVAVIYKLRTEISSMYGNYTSYREDPGYRKKIELKRNEYLTQLRLSSFKTEINFEKHIAALQHVFQNRALVITNNILNNTQNLITQERNSYATKPSRLQDMAVLLYEAKIEYEEYLAHRWDADMMAHNMEQSPDYSFKGMFNDNDAMAISSLQRSMNEVAKVRDAGHPLLDYFIQPGRTDELGELLGYSYSIGNNYLNKQNNDKNPYRTRFQTNLGEEQKTKVVDTGSLFNVISSVVDRMNGNINTTRQNLQESPKKVWDLDNVVAFTFDDMGIKEGTAPNKMVREELNRRQSIKFFKEIFLAACNIGLAILACSGIGTPFAILAGLGAAAISSYQYFEHKSDYEFQKAASGTGTSAGTSLLSHEPDAVWLLLDLVAIGIDVFAALKIIAAVGKTAKLFRLANATDEAVIKARLLDELDNALRTNVAKQADELIEALRRQLYDADHVKDIRTKDYSVNEIKTKVDAADTPRVYEKAELKRIVANAEQIGDVKVWRGKEAEQFLNQNGANGMYLLGEAGQPGALVLRESASRNVIIEELLHLEQHRILGFRELSTPDFIRLEIEAQEALLKYAKASKWTDDEIKLIEENQQYWRSKENEYKLNPQSVELKIQSKFSSKRIIIGKKIGQKGDYEVFEGGEVFYRTIYTKDIDELIQNNKIVGSGECSTSPTQRFSESYDGVLVKFVVKHGTIDELVKIGVTDGKGAVQSQFGKMPLASEIKGGWNVKHVRFKFEKGQVNIQLGMGKGVEIFNNNIVNFEIIRF